MSRFPAVPLGDVAPPLVRFALLELTSTRDVMVHERGTLNAEQRAAFDQEFGDDFQDLEARIAELSAELAYRAPELADG